MNAKNVAKAVTLISMVYAGSIVAMETKGSFQEKKNLNKALKKQLNEELKIQSEGFKELFGVNKESISKILPDSIDIENTIKNFKEAEDLGVDYSIDQRQSLWYLLSATYENSFNCDFKSKKFYEYMLYWTKLTNQKIKQCKGEKNSEQIKKIRKKIVSYLEQELQKKQSAFSRDLERIEQEKKDLTELTNIIHDIDKTKQIASDGTISRYLNFYKFTSLFFD